MYLSNEFHVRNSSHKRALTKSYLATKWRSSRKLPLLFHLAAQYCSIHFGLKELGPVPKGCRTGWTEYNLQSIGSGSKPLTG